MLTAYKGKDEIAYPVRIFLHFDPLILVTTLLAAHTVPAALFLSLVICAVTIVFGRAFCGWVCPFGTMHDAMGLLATKKNRRSPLAPIWRRPKYYLLIFVSASSFFTLQVAGLVDPISLLIRSLAIAVEPVTNLITHNIFDLLYRAKIPLVTDVSEAIYAPLKKYLLSFRQPYFAQGLLILLLFAAVLLANLFRRRLWCTTFCPLGALLGLIATLSPFKRSVGKGCTSCGACVKACRNRAAADGKGEWQKGECIVCGECAEECPEEVVRFGFHFRAKGRIGTIELSRRALLASLLASILFVPIVRTTPLSKRRQGRLIRPPGALREGEFLRRCVRCGECMKVCLTNGLQPALFEAGLEGLWTPRFDFRVGYCQYACTLCGQVCPTGAIQRLSQQEKAHTKIGLAYIDKDRCIPYAQGVECLVCEEHCPTTEKAIHFEVVQVRTKKGLRRIRRPVVDLGRCIGCGICEHKCPLIDQPAIIVTRLGETRGDELLPSLPLEDEKDLIPL